jgi:glycosyltransferase involved in cell wall biosynthesis
MNDPSISIAMCTYNGVKHVLQQMESFAAQSLLPAELVVCDDLSTDETVEVIRAFANRAPFAVRLEVNEANLGYSENFMKSFGLTSGELILCSDQDDVWHPEKLRKFADKFRLDPDPGLILCDANLVDQDLKPIGLTLWQSRKFWAGARRKVAGVTGAAVILKDPTWFASGATMGFASKYKSLVLPLVEGWTHDAWIATLVASVAPVGLIPEPLNDYRQHTSQVFGGTSGSVGHVMNLAKARASTEDHFLATAERYRQLAARLKEADVVTLDPAMFRRVERKIAHWERRSKMRKVSKLARFPLIGRELALGRYQSYSQGWKSMAVDVLY